MDEAERLFNLAASKGDLSGIHWLGMEYLEGSEIPKNKEKGRHLLKQAAAKGFEKSESSLI